MEREIGSKFLDKYHFDGVTLQVVKGTHNECDGCFYDIKNYSCNDKANVGGTCGSHLRSDKTGVIFVKVISDETR